MLKPFAWMQPFIHCLSFNTVSNPHKINNNKTGEYFMPECKNTSWQVPTGAALTLFSHGLVTSLLREH